MPDPKIEAVQRMYEALGRGDIEAILAEVADEVDWVSVTEKASALVPWYGNYRGKAEVARFFKEIGSNVQITEFSPLSFTSNETDVMVALRWSITVNSTGKSLTLSMQHWFRFADGKVVSVRACEDSEQTAAAFS
jgi:ketosteroid isomerase-like protein